MQNGRWISMIFWPLNKTWNFSIFIRKPTEAIVDPCYDSIKGLSFLDHPCFYELSSDEKMIASSDWLTSIFSFHGPEGSAEHCFPPARTEEDIKMSLIL